MDFNKWLDTFVEEKGFDLDHEFEIEDPNPNSLYGTHFFSLGYIIKAIKTAPAHERAAIKDMIVKIDFAAPNKVLGYFEHLAKALVNNQS